MQVFVVGPPRSGTTIVAQVLNTHPRIKVFDEVDFIDVDQFGEQIVGKLRAFLMARGLYDAYRAGVGRGGDCGRALDQVMTFAAGPDLIWGEKNPMYATRLDVLRRAFPEALILFVLRDPRAVVNAYLAHRASPSRSRADFWIKNTVTEALTLAESCLQPLQVRPGAVSVLRYEHFIEDPKAALDAVLQPLGLVCPKPDMTAALRAPETVGDHQFFRQSAVLPWKCGNLSPLRRELRRTERLDPADPAWMTVDGLAETFGYA